MMSFNEIKNLDIGELFKSLLSNRGSLIKGSYAKIILWGILGVSLLVAYVTFVFVPHLEQRQAMQKLVDSVPQMESQLKYLEVANKRAEDDLLEAEKSYAHLNQLFSVESELEELYQRLSQMASSQGLTIVSLTKEGEDAIYAGSKQVATQAANGAPQLGTQTPPVAGQPQANADGKATPAKPLFYRIKLKIEMTGQYSRYMRFRQLLADFDKSINIDKELITLVPGDSRGIVIVKSSLSTFRLAEKLSVKKAQLPQSNNGVNLARYDNLQGGVGNLSWRSKLGFIKVAGNTSADPLSNPQASSKGVGSAVPPGAVVNANEEVIMGNGAANNAKRGNRTVERDPFSRSASGVIEGGRDPRVSPLLMASPESYVINGLIVSSSVKAAMIRTDFRENYVVKIGDRLGNQGGVIESIDMDGIVVLQPSGRIRLYVQSINGQPGMSDSGRPNSGAPR